MVKKPLKIIFTLVTTLLIAAMAVGCSGNIDTMKRIKDDGQVIMGTNAAFPPFEMRQGDAIVGIDAEIAQAIADKLGVKLKIEDMDFEALPSALKSGKVDFIAAGYTIRPDRQEEADFSDTYLKAVQAIIVLKDNDTIKTAEDLNGKRIGTQEGTTGTDLFRENSPYKDVKLTTYKKGADAVLDLKNKRVDAVVLDNYTSMALADLNPEIKLLDEPAAPPEEYAIAVRKGDTELLQTINDTLKELKDSGKLEEIFKKYISDYRSE
ncbi:basic amino acid ABC transporter substrate-binding protein [Mahella australiensis]|uniref:Extracellular solute-binding protein family 3 n=1 Tax=Mahella australiensis (strain DSM 15567 / CIP 107919 / 50-1 BON) TaxID=697281 RepID=F3ZZ77_MAHA5|nr:basic amino acid ABC transporter substrate-binding protein [Mahella australiensis]AEE97859.1 extracellular solute-binding protein family 3 [Mahella australiensis 50-1 BON]